MPRSPASPIPTKSCLACGRVIAWRKKWERDWDGVRYCSAACRRQGVNKADRALEDAIIGLLRARGRSATICPGEAARRVDESALRSLMEPARRAARRLAEQGVVEITQQGKMVDGSTAKGHIRIRLTAPRR